MPIAGLKNSSWVGSTKKNLLALELPQYCKDCLHAILCKVPHLQKQIFEIKWKQILAEFGSMVIVILGSRGPFSLLQEALLWHQNSGHICLSCSVHDILSRTSAG